MLGALRTDNSPFDEQQLEALNRALESLEPHQSLWLSGYLAGLSRALPADALAGAAAPVAQAGETLQVFYGSETGNGETLAQRLAETARGAGLTVETASLDGLRLPQLARLTNAVFIVSTHGEGDPPEEALDFFEALDGPRAPRLEQLRYRILALGDRSYTHFCAAGVRLDERLAALGASRFGTRVDCDVDYGPGYEAWATEVLAWSHDHLAGGANARPAARLSVVRNSPSWTRDNPFEAEVLDLRPITGIGSPKDVRHIALSLEGSGLAYAPGDALGVWAPNRDDTVAEILEQLGIDPAARVSIGDEALTVAESLTQRRELTRLDAGTIENYARATGRADLLEAFQAFGDNERSAFIEARQFADLVTEFPGKTEAQTLVDGLRPLAPRSYSIASSADYVGEEVHLTVATVRSQAGATPRQGLASGHLNLDLEAGARVRVFAEPNRRFHLPEDDAPIVMIGAGTGVAPYRAFAQQLEADGRDNEAWLIFGNPHLRTDFLYQRDWLKWRETGQVGRIDAAWSRDQEEKRYVQHIVAEQAERLDEWLARGAHVYLCGALAMGHAVQDALVEGLARVRGTDSDAAREAVADLRRAGRLHKDLY